MERFQRKTKDEQNQEVAEFLDSISNDELEKIWFDYRCIIKCACYDNPLTIDMQLAVNEAQIYTYPIDKTIEYISSYFDLIPAQIRIRKSEAHNEMSSIIVFIPVINDNLELMIKAMYLCGYYLRFPKEKDIKAGQINMLQFEPVIQKDESESIRKSENKLYHLTPFYNVGKIKHIGFSPRSKNELFNYPGRVYFLRGSLDKEVIKAIGEKLSAVNSNERINGEYALITIDITKIPNIVKIYLDPNYPQGVFVMENIDPNAITDIKKISLRD